MHIRELYAALIDVNAGKRQELAAPNGSVHYYEWLWPMSGLDKQLARLKDGQTVRKRLLFALRAVMQSDDGSSKYVAHGGSYHIDLIWTRQNGNIQLGAKFVTPLNNYHFSGVGSKNKKTRVVPYAAHQLRASCKLLGPFPLATRPA